MNRTFWWLGVVAAVTVGCSENDLISSTDEETPESAKDACLQVTPGSLDFGALEVEVDPAGTQIVTVQNVCEGDLEIYSLQLADAGAPFVIGALGAVLLPANATTDFTVTFDPSTADLWETSILIESNDADEPTVSVPLLGEGIAPVIEVSPTTYDFGAPYLGCELEQPFTIRNVGTADLVVEQIEFASGSVDFAFDTDLELPLVLAPNEEIEVDVGYAGLDEFDDTAYLTIESSDPSTPVVVSSITATAQFFGNQIDAFEQPLKKTADILFVVDNSCSMGWAQTSLAENFESFVDTLIDADSDYQLAVITTDDPNFRGPIITSDDSDPIEEFQTQALAGINGSGDEKPLEMAWKATQPGGDAGPGSAFLRENSTLSIVVLTDEADSSPKDPEEYVDYFLSIKGGDTDLVRIHAIAGEVPNPSCNEAYAATGLDEAVALTTGQFVSICSPDWGQNLESVAEGSITVHDSFNLTGTPVPETIEVTIDGIWTTTGWSYDATNNSVVFAPASIPAGGSSVEIEYDLMPDCEG